MSNGTPRSVVPVHASPRRPRSSGWILAANNCGRFE
jgi:hypothetical protein